MAECLQPQDLLRWCSDVGAPDSVCSLFLSFPATSALGRYSFLEYFLRLSFVCLLDFCIVKFFLRLSSWTASFRSGVEMNFITHPLVFFFTPIIGAKQDLAIGRILTLNLLILLFLKGFYFFRYMNARVWQGSLALAASVVLAWYAGAIVSL